MTIVSNHNDLLNVSYKEEERKKGALPKQRPRKCSVRQVVDELLVPDREACHSTLILGEPSIRE